MDFEVKEVPPEGPPDAVNGFRGSPEMKEKAEKLFGVSISSDPSLWTQNSYTQVLFSKSPLQRKIYEAKGLKLGPASCTSVKAKLPDGKLFAEYMDPLTGLLFEGGPTDALERKNYAQQLVLGWVDRNTRVFIGIRSKDRWAFADGQLKDLQDPIFAKKATLELASLDDDGQHMHLKPGGSLDARMMLQLCPWSHVNAEDNSWDGDADMENKLVGLFRGEAQVLQASALSWQYLLGPPLGVILVLAVLVVDLLLPLEPPSRGPGIMTLVLYFWTALIVATIPTCLLFTLYLPAVRAEKRLPLHQTLGRFFACIAVNAGILFLLASVAVYPLPATVFIQMALLIPIIIALLFDAHKKLHADMLAADPRPAKRLEDLDAFGGGTNAAAVMLFNFYIALLGACPAGSIWKALMGYLLPAFGAVVVAFFSKKAETLAGHVGYTALLRTNCAMVFAYFKVSLLADTPSPLQAGFFVICEATSSMVLIAIALFNLKEKLTGIRDSTDPIRNEASRCVDLIVLLVSGIGNVCLSLIRIIQVWFMSNFDTNGKFIAGTGVLAYGKKSVMTDFDSFLPSALISLIGDIVVSLLTLFTIKQARQALSLRGLYAWYAEKFGLSQVLMVIGHVVILTRCFTILHYGMDFSFISGTPSCIEPSHAHEPVCPR
eukprot:CAMPEP_0197683772 /NCGR_PEP_ID=MMETSP1338-20131121/98487_1 /TAXON_ID=43686 ORGANISM="Pelagodinium beii, Strain RCC1491" /NCGR_SAMPLE_ID=MMETSP1338 /ASSEMBLY_ACC=CAM_ASM_000754 /LENGTH=658 /DNA_ID=CAMNT_0043265403 /DNA_START=29 /DNA_END=2005 /DNA_ORIENTATION=+